MLCCRDIINRVVHTYSGCCRSRLGSAYSSTGSSHCHSWFTFMATPSPVSFAWLLRLILWSRWWMLWPDSAEAWPLTCLSLPSCCWNVTPRLTRPARHYACIWDNLSHSTNSLCSPLAENQSDVGSEIFRIFDEAKPNNRLVTGTEMFLCHGHNGCCLPYASDVDFMQPLSKTNLTITTI